MGLSYLETLDGVVSEVVAPQALAVDRDGAFPESAMDALGKAGILGMASANDVGGGGAGMRDAAAVVERLAGACGSTAMVTMMHFAGVAAIEAHGPTAARREIAAGRHLTTLAFSEAGSRSHFWAPLGTARSSNGKVRLDARKSWVTSAGEADSYVWSSLPVEAEAPMTLWLVPAEADGLRVAGEFDGLGLRGNGSKPMVGDRLSLPRDAMLGADGAGLDIALGAILPWFLVLNASFSLGLMEAAVADTAAHITAARLDHLGQTLAEQPLTRVEFARMRLETDAARALLDYTLTAVESGRADATLRVLEIKAALGESAINVTDRAMKVCGGAAFRKELGLERRFRDARAARVMAPTSDALLDFVGRVCCGMPLFDAVGTQVRTAEPLLVGAVAYSANVVPIWEGIRDYFRDSPAEMDFVLFSNYGRQVDELLAGTIDIAWNTNLAWARTVARTDGACRALAMRDTDTGFRTMFVARTGTGLSGLENLRGKRLALGSKDSAQAAILPVHFLTGAGLDTDAVELMRIDSDVGKHGDTGRSELAALRAVLDERADAAAIGINTWEGIGRDELMPGAFEVFWESPTYSHCNFTALPGLAPQRAQPWVDHLLAMDWDNPEHRPILEMEGLRRWVTPQLDGYASLFAAIEEQEIPARW